MIIIAGRIKVKPERKKDFINLSQSCVEPSRSEPGCLSYSYYEDQTQENTFLFFEEWQDQAAVDYHFQTPYFHEFLKQYPDLVTEAPIIKVYQVSSFQQV